jgi:hypothetical protein
MNSKRVHLKITFTISAVVLSKTRFEGNHIDTVKLKNYYT